MKRRICMCGHDIGRHSHLAIHPCKSDKCGCPWFELAAPQPSNSGEVDRG